MNGRQFEQKSFSVFNNYSRPKCICGKDLIYGYCTQEGTLCPDCYQDRKRQKELEKIKDRL